LTAIVQQPECTEEMRLRANDSLTFTNPALTRNQITEKEASRLRLVKGIPDILAPDKQKYTKYHARKIAARILSETASQAEQSVLQEHGVDYQTAYRLSGTPNKEGILRESTFASKKDDQYRLLSFDSRGGCEEKGINELGLRRRFDLEEGKNEREARRKPCGTYCSKIDGVTAWTQHQEGNTYTEHRDDIGSYRKCVADIRAVLNLPGSSVGGADILRAKNRLWKSKYNHPKLRGAYPNGRPQQGAMEVLCGRIAAEIVLSRESESDTVRSLNQRYTDLSKAILLDCEVNENGSFDEKDLSIARSSFFVPADSETSQSVDPFDQAYDLVSIDNGKVVSVMEHSVGEMVGKLRLVHKSTKSGPSKRKENKSDQAAEGSKRSRPRVVG